jgi:hypothetical protein
MVLGVGLAQGEVDVQAAFHVAGALPAGGHAELEVTLGGVGGLFTVLRQIAPQRPEDAEQGADAEEPEEANGDQPREAARPGGGAA